MKEARKGQIALLILKYVLKENGINVLEKSFGEGLEEFSKATGISEREAKEFAEIMIREHVDSVFKNI